MNPAKQRIDEIENLLADIDGDPTHPANDSRHPKHGLCLIGIDSLRFELIGLHTEATLERLFNSAQVRL